MTLKKMLYDRCPVCTVDWEIKCAVCEGRGFLPVGVTREQVDAAIAERDRLLAYVRREAACPCCDQPQQCDDGCTLHLDDPDGFERLQAARNVLGAQDDAGQIAKYDSHL